MANKTKNRIAYKQAKFVLIISLVLGLVFTSFQLYLDLKQEKKHLISDLNRIINLHKESAALSVYNLNTQKAAELTKTLIEQPEIYQAILIDDFGETLAEQVRQPVANNYLVIIGETVFDIPEMVEEKLILNGLNHGGAKLIISLDSAYISSAFAQRAIVNLLFSLVYDLVLVAVLIFIFYRYLSRPITNISEWVEGLREGKKNEQLPYTEPDEIGDLVDNFSRLWSEHNEIADQLYQTVGELSKSEHFSRSLMDNAGDAMYLCLADSTIVQVNLRAVQSLGVQKRQLEGQKLASFSHSFSEDSLVTLLSSFEENKVVEFEDQHLNFKGKAFPIEARGIKLNLQEKSYILIMARDITTRKETEKQIHKLAYFDSLTGLPNRQLFLDNLDNALDQHCSNSQFGAVLYIDLDHFKTINDSLGHAVGDGLLCETAKRLTEFLPNNSTCSRFGGDEFIVLLPELADQLEVSTEKASQIAASILEKMSLEHQTQGHTLYCSASIGIAMFPKSDEDSADILRSADTALYRAKALGRNGYQFFNPEMQSSATQRLNVEKGLFKALENNEFELWFQPQVEPQGKMIGVEALLRWNHPEKGILMPGAFIDIAEDSGQIIEIGKWVLENALQQLVFWMKEGLPEGFKRLSVNVSPIQFMQVDFVDHVFQLMDELQVPGNMLELEITENTLVNNFEVACNKMKILKLRGISFAIDDFGTGYSSLQYLQHLPLDILKIDRSFVTDLATCTDKVAIVEVIVTIADRLNLTVIAEGVETQEEFEALKALGCLWYQGYLFSKPVPATALYNEWVKVA